MHPHDDTTTSPRRRSASVPLWILVILGLVLAASGGAVAGGKINGKQIKANTITGKQVKNKSLGLHDLKVKDVQALAAAGFGTPPSGTTMVGGGIIAQDTPSDSRYSRGIAPLPFKTATPMSVLPGSRNLYFGSTDLAYPGESNSGLCSGSATNPTAAPGIMCVYISGTTTNAGNQLSFVFPGANTAPDGADSTLFYVGVSSDEQGEVLVRFVWAYTAP